MPTVSERILHAAWFVHCIERRRKTIEGAARIDGLLALALSYIIWFGVIPLFNLLALWQGFTPYLLSCLKPPT